ncbi:MAG: helix-turn-helix domain-containing protein [Bdellovibrionales bacterium]|jgi:transcriptional regulator with XRE-family HTH domain
MITAAQLRAARGLLDWTRSELAKASGLSAETIKNIEHGVYMPQDSTISAIVKAFAEHNVEFTEHDGVRKNVNIVINYEGTADFRRYADDIYKILLNNPQDRRIYIFGNNDKEFIDALGDYAKMHLQRMSKLEKLDFKALVVEGVNVMVTKYIRYRKLPQMAFTIPFSVYENRFDFIIYGEGPSFPKVVAIKSESVANAYRSQFDALWKLSQDIAE